MELIVAGADLVDGTPVLDIKPYIPYADALPSAQSAFADAAPELMPVKIPEEILLQAKAYRDEWETDLPRLIEQVLAQDPRPAYQKIDPERIYGMKLCNFNLCWRHTGAGIEVVSLREI